MSSKGGRARGPFIALRECRSERCAEAYLIPGDC